MSGFGSSTNHPQGRYVCIEGTTDVFFRYAIVEGNQQKHHDEYTDDDDENIDGDDLNYGYDDAGSFGDMDTPMIMDLGEDDNQGPFSQPSKFPAFEDQHQLRGGPPQAHPNYQQQNMMFQQAPKKVYEQPQQIRFHHQQQAQQQPFSFEHQLVFSPSLSQLEGNDAAQHHRYFQKMSLASCCQEMTQQKLAAYEEGRTENTSQDQFQTLPDEIVQHVFSFLSEKEVCKASQVCSRFHGLVRSGDLIWKKLCLNRWDGCLFPTPQLPAASANPTAVAGAASDPTGPWYKHFRTLYELEMSWTKKSTKAVARTLLPSAEPGSPCEDVMFFRTHIGQSLLVTISSRGVVSAWDLQSLARRFVVSMPALHSDNPPVRLAITQHMIAIGLRQGQISLHCSSTGAHVTTLVCHQPMPELWGLFPLDNGDILACHIPALAVRWSTSALLRGPQNLPLVRQVMAYNFSLPGHNTTDDVFYVVPDCERGRIISTHQSGAVHVWDVATGSHIMAMLGHADVCTRACILDRQGGSVLVTSSLDGTLRLWDMSSGACLNCARVGSPVVGLCAGACGPEWVAIMCVDPNTHLLVTTFEVWNTVGNVLELVKSIPRAPAQWFRAGACCFFDGVRGLITCESPFVPLAGAMEVLSVA